jgi:hypothetical protein
MSQEALDLLLSGVKDQGQRKQITSAYYAFAAGDPETAARLMRFWFGVWIAGDDHYSI